MRFNEQLHWSDGLFLEPHHFQQLQRELHQALRAERRLVFPFPYGFIDLEIDEEALAARRIVVKRFSAVMPNGEELSSPGNTSLPPLVVEPPAAEGADAARTVLVWLTVPNWSAVEGNLADRREDERLFSVRESRVRDENTGENETSVLLRTLNASLTTTPQAKTDVCAMPLMRFVWMSRSASEPRLALDSSFMPPFLLVADACPLVMKINELLFELRGRRDRIQTLLEETGFNAETLGGAKLHHMLELLALNRFEAQMGGELAPGRMTPWALYLSLRTLFGELSALQPLSKCEDVPLYNHDNAMPAFEELLRRIRSLLLVEGAAGYVKADFVPADGLLEAKIPEETLRADACFLALRSSRADTREMVREVESGDNFRLLEPAAVRSRIRGVKLREMRYPPRYLPVLAHTAWFRLETESSELAWSAIVRSGRAAIDCVASHFPDVTASLYVTVLHHLDRGSGRSNE